MYLATSTNGKYFIAWLTKLDMEMVMVQKKIVSNLAKANVHIFAYEEKFFEVQST